MRKGRLKLHQALFCFHNLFLRREHLVKHRAILHFDSFLLKIAKRGVFCEHNTPAISIFLPRNNAQQRRFACTVRAYERKPVIGLQLNIHAGK